MRPKISIWHTYTHEIEVEVPETICPYAPRGTPEYDRFIEWLMEQCDDSRVVEHPSWDSTMVVDDEGNELYAQA